MHRDISVGNLLKLVEPAMRNEFTIKMRKIFTVH